MKTLKVAFLINPIEEMHYEDDTTFSIMHDLYVRGHKILHLESKDLFLHDNMLTARVNEVATSMDRGVKSLKQYEMMARDWDVLFIRKEPPLDVEYIAAMQLLKFIKGKVLCINDPAGILWANEKMSIQHFSQHCPLTYVGSQAAVLLDKARSTHIAQWVLKPLNEKGGRGIKRFNCNENSSYDLLEDSIKTNASPIQIQEYIHHKDTGDKRILLFNAEPIGAFVRFSAPGEFRANLALGARAAASNVSEQDMKIISSIRSFLISHGLLFVGIDIIANRLSEINVTSPAGIPEINKLSHVRIEKVITRYLENQLLENVISKSGLIQTH